MKTLLIIFSIVGLITFSSCNQKTDVNALLQNTETKNEIFSAVIKDHNMMMSFMEKMQGNEHAMQMMQGNKKMMDMMMKDSLMKNNMMHSIMKDGNMMGDMMKMMNKEGMMSEDCMKSCIKMMGDKGMNMMEGKDEKTEEDHDSHH